MLLLDTDTISLLHSGHPRPTDRLRANQDVLVTISVVTRIEILQARFAFLIKAANGSQLLTAQEWLDRSEMLLAGLRVLPIDSEVAHQFDRLLAVPAVRKIGRADLLIASTALANRATLITRNTRHFAKVPALNVDNWAD